MYSEAGVTGLAQSSFAVDIVDSAVEQEEFQFLFVVPEQLKVDL
jgi:hypothetical protein